MADAFAVSSNSSLIERKYFNASLEWKIARVKSRFGTSGDVVTSPLFQCSDASWQLKAFFLGISDDDSSNRIHLICTPVASTFLYTAHINLSICCDQGKKLDELTNGKYVFNRNKLCADILTRSSNFHVRAIGEGAVTINFSISLDENDFPVFPSIEATKEDGDKKSLVPKDRFISSSADFEELFNTGHHTDVTLKIGGEEFELHKSVLSARSTVFKAMFDHDMKENRQKFVDLEQMEVKTAQVMLRYIYCGKVSDLSADEALNLYIAAHLYELKELKTLCSEVVLLNISINNVCRVAEVANLYEDEVLIKALKSFLSKNGKEIIKTEAWRALCTSGSVLCGKMFDWAFSE